MTHQAKTALKPLALLLGSLVFAGTSQAALWTTGHGDFGVALEDHGGSPELHFHAHLHTGAVVDGTPLVDDEEYDADEITVNVPLITKISAPNSAAFNTGTGAAAGTDIWLLPQGNPGADPIPFLGIATEELDPADWVGDIVFSLIGVTSPTGTGDFSLYQADGFGGLDFYFSTADAAGTVNGDNTLNLLANVHDHFNWGFTEAGTWLVEISVSGVHNTLGVLTDTQTFTFNVVPEPSAYAALLGLGALAMGLARRRR